jgi:hypothetical protein
MEAAESSETLVPYRDTTRCQNPEYLGYVPVECEPGKLPAPTQSIPSITQRLNACKSYEGVFKSFRTGRLEREMQMVQLSATRCSSITIL